jgi:large subunit ribosomal protein L14
MIQIGTVSRVVDNSGARTARCIKIYKGSKKRYGFVGDILLVSIQNLRSKRRDVLKVKKGELYKALLLRTQSYSRIFCGDASKNFGSSSIILINKKNKFLGTRIFGSVNTNFRFTKYMKILFLSSGICAS